MMVTILNIYKTLKAYLFASPFYKFLYKYLFLEIQKILVIRIKFVFIFIVKSK